MKKYLLILLLLIFSLSFTFPASAMVCRKYQNQEICILSIKRSAKKYWEYRASVSINGTKTPVEIYNCRGKFKVNKDGTVKQFEDNSPGELICGFFQK
ncbi:MAG: hypothetical protein EAZ76_12265 [Nostocales cyanobacterium]|nr:MAG: hypothetical protein EAZ87_03885 [Nostocales cyanobacterium]TAF13183.1 MAG: hypothetical protein EAZ76_12265 [Nostocales cyanobacterium]